MNVGSTVTWETAFQMEWHDARSMNNILRYLKSIFSACWGDVGTGSYTTIWFVLSVVKAGGII